jgi:stalled ribosome rescue protein Dom34
MTYHACVWIDHRQAKVFGISPDEVNKTTVGARHQTHHIHRKADHVGLGKEPMSPDFLAEIAEALQQAKAILIAGPGTARTELAGYLHEHYPALARRVWGVEPMDHPSVSELFAGARRYFHAADRMHG